RLRLSNQDVGSMYQLRETLLERGVSSHWTPYVRVIDVDDSIRRTALFGGTVVVHPFLVSGVSRIALILDSVGALVGLWESVELMMMIDGHVFKNSLAVDQELEKGLKRRCWRSTGCCRRCTGISLWVDSDYPYRDLSLFRGGLELSAWECCATAIQNTD